MSTTAIGAQQALIQSNLEIAAIKSTANSEKAVANLIAEASNNVPTSSSLGTKVDISA